MLRKIFDQYVFLLIRLDSFQVLALIGVGILAEANISMKGVDAEESASERRRFNNDVFCFAIQWIRLVG